MCTMRCGQNVTQHTAKSLDKYLFFVVGIINQTAGDCGQVGPCLVFLSSPRVYTSIIFCIIGLHIPTVRGG